MLRRPKVSVIIPTYNRAKLLRRAMTSVLAQSFDDFELIVIDDCSTDATQDIIHSFTDSRIVSRRLPKQENVCVARNEGLKIARGDYISFQDDDDIWFGDKLLRQVAELDANPDIGLNLCGYLIDADDGVTEIAGEQRFRDMDFARGPMKGFALIATPAWLVRRALIEQVGGFDPNMRVRNDWELAYRLSRITRFSHLARPLFLQDHSQGGSLWNKHAAVGPVLRYFLEKHAADLQKDPRLTAGINRAAAQYFLFYGDAACAERHTKQAIKLNPAHIKGWALYGLAWLGPDFRQKVVGIYRTLRNSLRKFR